MGIAYAEVIGDPVGHSQSPLIHQAWLSALGIPGDYRASRVTPSQLATFLAARRDDPDWRGCNVTIPHKQSVLDLVDRIEPGAREIGAVNCISRSDAGLVGRNSDIDGVAAALAGVEIPGAKAVLIGAGGAARAAVRHVLDRGAGSISILVRDPVKAEGLRRWGADGQIEIWPMAHADDAMAGSTLIINASPMGMAGMPAMPAGLLASVTAHASGATLFDMVYQPLETEFLAAARRGSGTAVDGLTMLIGQARAAFHLFFGQPAPADGEQILRDLMAT